MSYPSSQPLPPGSYQWRLTVKGPDGNGRTLRQDHWGTYGVAPGDRVTALDILEEVRVSSARQMGIPIHTATTANFTLHN